MGRRLVLTFNGLILVSLLACGEGFQARSQSSDIWLPWPMADFSYSFQYIRVQGLTDPRRASGPAAQVYFQAGGNQGGFSGGVAEPRLSRQGSRWIPLDVPSSEALTAYAVFARILKFDQQMDVASRLSWPRKVGIQIRVKTPKGRIFSNALYDADSDSVVLAKFNSDLAPLAVNHGVLAHEHFHAHFTALLMALGKGNSLRAISTEKGNTLLLAALNEGLADFYGAVFSGDPRFSERSFGFRGNERNLDEPMVAFDELPSVNSNADEVDVAYAMGTSFARSLYSWGTNMGPDGRAVVLKEVMRVLPLVLRDLLKAMNKGVVQPGEFFKVLLAHQQLPVPSAWCEEIREQIESTTAPAELRGCP